MKDKEFENQINIDSSISFNYSENLIPSIKYVGFWVIGDLNIGTFKKPNWIHQLFSKLLLGWEWRSI
jgi:hypothetical protein